MNATTTVETKSSLHIDVLPQFLCKSSRRVFLAILVALILILLVLVPLELELTFNGSLVKLCQQT